MKILSLLMMTFSVGLISCNSQTRINECSKSFTKKAMGIMDSTYFLQTKADTNRYLYSINLLDSAIHCDSSNYFAFWKKSELLFNLKKYNESLTTVKNYTKYHKENLNFQLREAYLYDKIKDTASAYSMYQKVLALIEEELHKRPDNIKMMTLKYYLLFLLNDKDIANYKRELKLKLPENDFNFIINLEKDKGKFIDYQLSGGELEEVNILKH